MNQAGFIVPKLGLETLGLKNLGNVHWNLSVPALYEEAIRRREGQVGDGGAFVVRTGVHTGRSPNDKFFVEDQETKGRIDWGKTNKPIAPERYRALYNRMLSYAQRRDLFVRDCWAGADPAHRIGVRVITETAWHNLFARNMFLRPRRDELEGFKPQFTILNLPGFQADPKLDGTASDCAILVNFTDRVVAICGTWYAGEIKKSVFTILNYLLPDKNVLPMHASANVGPKGDVAIFFGLSGTGKTTLSADPSRTLLGDDEHGWGEESLFNFEGGCYAKVIKLSREAEPEIYATTERFGTVLENVVIDPRTGALDLDDGSYTENTRACYPLEFIPNASATGLAPTPENIVMLTADAFGVLPPISQLSPRAGDVPLPVGLYRARGRHREGRDRTAGDFLDLLRRAVHAAPSHGLRQDAGREDGPPAREVLAGQHRLVGRRLRRWRAHVDSPYPRHGAGGARRQPGRGGKLDRSALWHAGTQRLPGRAGRGAESEEHLEGQEGLRQRRARRRQALRGQFPAVRGPRRRQGQAGRDPGGGLKLPPLRGVREGEVPAQRAEGS